MTIWRRGVAVYLEKEETDNLLFLILCFLSTLYCCA